MWTVDVTLATHDAVKHGVIDQGVSRVHLSTADFPDPLDAEVCAAQLSLSIHLNAMATKVVHCL